MAAGLGLVGTALVIVAPPLGQRDRGQRRRSRRSRTCLTELPRLASWRHSTAAHSGRVAAGVADQVRHRRTARPALGTPAHDSSLPYLAGSGE
jgi:hypothetical protein